MATTVFKYKFVVEPKDSVKCQICSQVAKYPMQHECGRLFCSGCIEKNESNTCPSCAAESPSYFVDARASQEIQDLPVKCNNLETGCYWEGCVGTLEEHLRECDIDEVPCKYRYVGCDVKMGRKHITKHEEEADKKHLQLALQHIAPTLSDGEFYVFKLTEYSKRKQNQEIFLSDAFYTHVNGYKMCFKIYLDGTGSGKGSHLSVELCLLRGPYDETLRWPFSGSVSLHILNQTSERDHYGNKFKLKDGTLAKPGDKSVNEKFISHSCLSNDNCLCQDGSLYFRITVKRSSSQPWLECGKRVDPLLLSSFKVFVNRDPIVFKVVGFESLKDDGKRYVSSPFFTGRQGYKMRICIYPNGDGAGEGDHMSVFADMLEGPYDKNLVWPFFGTVEIELLNQGSDKHHHKDVVLLDREANMRVGDRIGNPKFIKHSELKKKQYLVNDTLYFRVSAKEDNYKSWLSCTP